MAISNAEVYRLKYELGYGTLKAGAEPYIGEVVAIFNQVIQTYLDSEASTTSATRVSVHDCPTPVALTLASVTGMTVGLRIAVDVDSLYEETTIQSVSGSIVTAPLALAHSGTYPVTSDGGEMIVRATLREIYLARKELSDARSSAGVSQIDKGDVKLHGRSSHAGGASRIAELQSLIAYWQDELAGVLGVANMRRARRASGGGISLG